MAEQVHKTDEVFGISREVPLNYVSRPAVDDHFIESLTRDRHIVVYGSSKQGKTCLRKKCLKDDEYITVHCLNRWTLGELHAAILKRAGYEITQSTRKTVTGKSKIDAKFSAQGLGLDIGLGGGKGSENSRETTTTELELDVDDVNDVIAALEKINFSKYIVLEDFHYLPIETQKDFSVALKAFHENSKVCFIIIGVWLEENRLTVYNGDLTGRITSVNADLWQADELRAVIHSGQALLNVSFDPVFVEQLVNACEGSVHIVQESCYKLCDRNGLYKTSDSHRSIGNAADVGALVKEVVDQQKGRYNSFLVQFADGFQGTSLQMYKWLLFPVITCLPADLEKGLRLKQIREILVESHPDGESLNTGNITQALQYSAGLQVKKDIKPIVLDYDQTNLRLNVVDRGFLIWLRHQDRGGLLDMLGLPRGGQAAG